MRRRTTRLSVRTYADQPDVFLVVSDSSEPDAVPVIPTSMAESYWTRPLGKVAAGVS